MAKKGSILGSLIDEETSSQNETGHSNGEIIHAKTTTTIPTEEIKKVKEVNETPQNKENKEVEKTNKKVSKSFSRTFYIPEDDHNTILNFRKFKITETGLKYSQRQVIAEALNLLQGVIESNAKPLEFTKQGAIMNAHTYTIQQTDFENIEKYLIYRRKQGFINYTQGNILSEGLNLLKKAHPYINF